MNKNERPVMKLTDQIRQVVRESGMSNYRLCSLIGCQASRLSRFMNGKGNMLLENMDVLAEFLGIEITARGPDARKLESAPKPGKPGRPRKTIPRQKG